MRARLVAPLLLATAACPRLDPMNTGENKVRAYREVAPGAGGSSMRHPPAGTVPHRSAVPLELGTGLAADGRPVAEAPFPVTAAALARGRGRYDVFCAVCHGVLGDGESQVALNMSLRRPPSLHLYRDVPDGHLYRVVTNGFGLMGSYAHELSVEDRWAVVAYVRALQLSQHATLEQLSPDDRRRLEQEAR